MQHAVPDRFLLYEKAPDDPGCGPGGHQHGAMIASEVSSYNQGWLDRAGSQVLGSGNAGTPGAPGSVRLPHGDSILLDPAGRPLRQFTPEMGRVLWALLQDVRMGRPVDARSLPPAAVMGGIDARQHAFARDFFSLANSSAFERSRGVMQIYPNTMVLAGRALPIANRASHGVDVAEIALMVCARVGIDPWPAMAAAIGHDIGHLAGGHPSEEVAPSSVVNWVRSTHEALSQFDGAHALGAPKLPEFVEAWLWRVSLGDESQYRESRRTLEFLASPGVAADEFDHALHGGLIAISMGLTFEVAVGIALHSWSLRAGFGPVSELVSLGDRGGYGSTDPTDVIKAGLFPMDQFTKLYRQTSSWAGLRGGDIDSLRGRNDGPDQIGLMLRRLIASDIAAVFESTGRMGVSPHCESIFGELRNVTSRFTFRRPPHLDWQRHIKAVFEGTATELAHGYEKDGFDPDTCMAGAVHELSRRTDRGMVELAVGLGVRPVLDGKRFDPRTVLAGPSLDAPCIHFVPGGGRGDRRQLRSLEETIGGDHVLWRGKVGEESHALTLREVLNTIAVMDAMAVETEHFVKPTARRAREVRPWLHIPKKGSAAFAELHSELLGAVGCRVNEALHDSPRRRDSRRSSLDHLTELGGRDVLGRERPLGDLIEARSWDLAAVAACGRYAHDHALTRPAPGSRSNGSDLGVELAPPAATAK